MALLLDLGGLVRRIRRVKLECQRPTYQMCGEEAAAKPGRGCEEYEVSDFWLYNATVANNCSVAMAFLARHGFDADTARLQVNNCGCGEYNLHMVNRVYS